MISTYQANDNKIICAAFQDALGILKAMLYNGDYYTSMLSSVCITYNRRIHRYQVSSSQDNIIPMNENPRGKDNYDTIRILDIPTSSDDFDRYIESQIELAKLNNTISERITDYAKEEQRRETRNELINSIVYIQSSSVSEKEAAHFEYACNSEITNRCIGNMTKKFKEQPDHETGTLRENIQHRIHQMGLPKNWLSLF